MSNPTSRTVSHSTQSRTWRLLSLLVGLALAAGCNLSNSDVDEMMRERARPKSEVVEARPETSDASQQLVKEKAETFFREWFQSHGHEEVISDGQGFGVADSPTRLHALLYGSDASNSGVVVEVEFRITLPSKQVIVEFVAGMGETEEQAVNDALVNFALTTFHVIYKGTINDDDPHMEAKPVTISGRDREAILGDVYVRGQTGDAKLDLSKHNQQTLRMLATVPMNDQPHWLKLVYGASGGEPLTVSVTLDNQGHEMMTERIQTFGWPNPKDGAYMAKQFIYIR